MMKATTNKHLQQLHQLAFGLRPAEELYDLTSDPWQMKNVASNPKYSADLNRLRTRLAKRLKETDDPRQTGGEVLWDYYPYYGVRKNRNWKVDPMPSKPVKR